MTIFLKKSPNPKKKYRVIFEDGSHVDFGARGYSDFTLHKNPDRMRLYVQRHGGNMRSKNALKIEKSSKENWSKKGIKTAGFWSRWLLWSYPSLKQAKTFMEKKFQLKIRNV